jgi:polysaccharide biosynthesis transport protein
MSQPESPTLDYLRILRRRKWVALQVLLLGPIVALFISVRQTPLYEASAGVLLSLDRGSNITQDAAAAPPEDPARVVANQAQVARALPVVNNVVRATSPAFANAAALLRHSSVTSKDGLDLLTFSVTHRAPQAAVEVANAYAGQFITYLQHFETSSVKRALDQVRERLATLKLKGADGALYAALRSMQERLQTLEALETPTASLVRRATETAKVQPRLARNLALGIGIGILLALAAAFLWDTLDSRIRSEDEIAELLGVPLLTRIRENPHLRGPRVEMLDAPNSPHTEGFRILRVVLNFLTRQRGPRSVLVTSAGDGEGKSTTIANLAVTHARSGLSVILVDLDLRFPSIDRLFGLEGRPGVTDVVLDHLQLDEALTEIPIGLNGPADDDRFPGSLHVLPAGPVSPEVREMAISHAASELLAQLGERADLVLVDAPPIVPVGDAQALLTHVDRLFVVVRSSMAHRRMLKELRRTLDVSGAPPMGFVLVADAEPRAAYSGYYGRHPAVLSKLRPRHAKVRRGHASADPAGIES